MVREIIMMKRLAVLFMIGLVLASCSGEPEATPTPEPLPTQALAEDGWPLDWPRDVGDLPAGNTETAEELFNTTYACSACHGLLGIPETNTVGPHLSEISEAVIEASGAGSLAQYVYESALTPNDFISPDCPGGPCAGPPSAMVADFSKRVGQQELADLIAYIVAGQIVIEE